MIIRTKKSSPSARPERADPAREPQAPSRDETSSPGLMPAPRSSRRLARSGCSSDRRSARPVE